MPILNVARRRCDGAVSILVGWRRSVGSLRKRVLHRIVYGIRTYRSNRRDTRVEATVDAVVCVSGSVATIVHTGVRGRDDVARKLCALLLLLLLLLLLRITWISHCDRSRTATVTIPRRRVTWGRVAGTRSGVTRG